MKHFLLILILSLGIFFSYGQTFPYFNSLSASTSDITLFGNSTNTTAGYPKFNNSFLYLTPNVNGTSGFALFNQATFPSSGGIHIEFEFSANPHTGTDGADGFSMFLFDANSNITASNVGPSGGSFGYSSSGTSQGLENAYLGIAFDEYGNFKAYENNKNGFPKTTDYFGSNNAELFRNHITIRGAAGKNFSTYNSGTSYNDYFWGYPVLYTASTQSSSSTTGVRYTGYLKTDYNSQNSIASATSTSLLPGDPNNALYGYSTSPVSSSSFTLGTATLATDTTSSDFRKAIIDITPVLSAGSVTGYNINVKIKHGSITETMVNSFFYPVGTLKYVDNRADGSATAAGVVTNINTTPPTNFGLGFAGSTGGNNNYHAIRNLFINIPTSAISNNDYASICLNENNTTTGSTTISPLINDQAYDNIQATPTSANISPSSFRFNSDAATLLDSSSSSSANQTITYSNGVMSSVTTTNTSGTWTYTTSSQQLTYTRAANYKGVAKVLYSITSSYTGLNNNTYRSKAASVSVGLTGPRVTRDSAYISLYTGIGTAKGSQNVITNDTSFTYVSGSSTLTTSGASAINTSSFYFSSGDGITNLGSTSMTNTYGNWTFSNNIVSVTPSNTFSGIATAYYRISTSDGCLSDVDTVIFNYPFSLPVKYSQELVASLQSQNSILLNWTTAQEINNSYFTILRSGNGSDWDSIGTVKSKFINGNGTGSPYSFTDTLFTNSINYYRLKQIDLDGTASLSRIVSVKVSDTQRGLKLFPNPASGTINIQNATIGANYRIISLDGKVMLMGIINNQTQSINIANLFSGFYLCEILDSTGAKQVLKFSKK